MEGEPDSEVLDADETVSAVTRAFFSFAWRLSLDLVFGSRLANSTS